MNEQELNEKLAEWAGCAMEYDRVYEKPFTQSLDACFKWLVPKLNHIEMVGHNGDFVWNPEIKDRLATVSTIGGKSPALALCLAIEKLIDKEE